MENTQPNTHLPSSGWHSCLLRRLVWLSIIVIFVCASLLIVRYWEDFWCSEPCDLVVLPGFQEGLTCLACAPDRPLIVAGGTQKSLTVWDPQRRELTHSLSTSGNANAICFSADGAKLAVGGDNGIVHIWDSAKWELALDFQTDARIEALVCMHREPYVVVGLTTGAVELWNYHKGKEVRQIGAFAHPIEAMAIEGKDETLALAAHSKDIVLLSVDGRNPSSALRGHSYLVTCLAFSPDGRFLASGDEVGQVIVWDWKANKRYSSWTAYQGWVKGLAWSGEGDLLATAGNDGKVRWRDVESDKEVCRYTAHPVCPVQAMSMVSGAEQLALGFGIGTVKTVGVPRIR
ncbi:MAG: WD40 repeat domain-containing protein [Gemmataceae bacterium]